MKPETKATLERLSVFLKGQGAAMRSLAGTLRERGIEDVSAYEHDADQWEEYAAAVDEVRAT